MFDLSSITFDALDANTYTVTIIGYKSDGSTITDGAISNTATVAAIELDSITGIVSFDFQVTAASSGVNCVGLDSFVIANPQSAGSINTIPVISGFNDVTYLENDVNQDFLQIDSDVAVTDSRIR